ncbi:MAG: carboxymuconolactone decarboxylase family protein [Acidimicrobiales bacterium]
MSTPRIELLDIEDANGGATAVGVFPFMAELNVFRMLLQHPKLAKALHDLLVTLLVGSSLDGRLRELVIMRIGWVSGSEYEWTQHWRIATQLGVTEADLLAVREWRASDLGPAERAVLAATDETLDTGTISAETWRTCEELLVGAEPLLELVVAIGTWRMFASVLRSLQVPLEEGVDGWPPDGRAAGGR